MQRCLRTDSPFIFPEVCFNECLAFQKGASGGEGRQILHTNSIAGGLPWAKAFLCTHEGKGLRSTEGFASHEL